MMGSSLRLFASLSQTYRILVETGTWLGDGIAVALQAGFEKVFSCDINEELVQQARARFVEMPVDVQLGASEDVLRYVTAQLDEAAVFFLDAHAMPPGPDSREFSASTLRAGDENNKDLHCPIQREINIILGSGFQGHAILVDDTQCFGTWAFHFLTEEQVCNQVRAMCPGMYKFGHFQNVLCIVPLGTPMPRESLVRRAGRRARGLLPR
jgi:SAM-dependent methyltransferase